MEKGTILIVDDNKGVLASLELLLETEFSEIKTAHHPNQIMSILNTSPVDVIILDMNFSAGINNGNEGLLAETNPRDSSCTTRSHAYGIRGCGTGGKSFKE